MRWAKIYIDKDYGDGGGDDDDSRVCSVVVALSQAVPVITLAVLNKALSLLTIHIASIWTFPMSLMKGCSCFMGCK